MTELEQKIEQANIERNRRFPLLAIVNNREEIRKISQATQDYMIELYPDMARIKLWEMIPRIVIEFLKATLVRLDKVKAMKKGESTIILGDIMEVGIDGLFTPSGDKEGNLSALIKCRSEFQYENISLPYFDAVSHDIAEIMRKEHCEGLPIQFFDDRELIKEISQDAIKVLVRDYGFILGDESDWVLLPLTFVAFFRKIREFLCEHKDDTEFGCEINFADILQVGIAKEYSNKENEPYNYYLFISANRVYKLDYTKDDHITEDVKYNLKNTKNSQ